MMVMMMMMMMMVVVVCRWLIVKNTGDFIAAMTSR